MTIYLGRRGYQYSPTTIHKYRNQELGLYSIVRQKKPKGSYEKTQKIFENTLNQDFTVKNKSKMVYRFYVFIFEKL